MTVDRHALKKRLDEATERLKRADDADDRFALGGEVRELEKRIEIAAGPDVDQPRYRRL